MTGPLPSPIMVETRVPSDSYNRSFYKRTVPSSSSIVTFPDRIHQVSRASSLNDSYVKKISPIRTQKSREEFSYSNHTQNNIIFPSSRVPTSSEVTTRNGKFFMRENLLVPDFDGQGRPSCLESEKDTFCEKVDNYPT